MSGIIAFSLNDGCTLNIVKFPEIPPEFEIVHQEGKTFLINLSDIARILRRSQHHIVKYLGMRLGKSTHFVEGIYSIDGEHSREEIDVLFFDFLKRFRCKCGNFKTILTVKKPDKVRKACDRCGEIEEFDSNEYVFLEEST
jgi:translation initiation factor 2 beta subunit (eIF-2beta)/eIF-5